MAVSLPARKATARGRRTPRASGDERERAILATAERLLEERPLSAISVEDLARGAGISRPTFYFYFPSKDAVVLTLVERTVAESDANREEALAKLAADPRAGWRHGLRASFEAFGSRRGVVLAAAELRTTNAEARELWAGAMEDWVTDVSSIIEAERARGAAPPGLPARELAIALLQMNERVQHMALAGEAPALAEDRVLDVLVDVWVRAIYGAVAAD
ncbi:MAG TPA: helix-turn-helix domain-containing protein [Solirubrobacterales bacterium]|nr:helix-turn-helix domain-containing protein [Solirubrobacterales bacterium]